MGSQGGNPEEMAAMIAGTALVVGVVISVLALAFLIFSCWLLSGCYAAIPQQFRKMEPGMVWLLLIPCFNIVWLFFVLPRLAQSFKAYFDSIGRTDVGNCGETLGWTCAGAVVGQVVLSWVPVINLLAMLTTLILMIVYLVKAAGLKKQVLAQVQA